MDKKAENLREIEKTLKKELPPGQSNASIKAMAKKIYDQGQKNAGK